MPTIKPRLTVTLDPDVYEALSSISEGLSALGNRVSKADLINQTMKAAVPQMLKIARLTQQLQNATPEVLAAVHASADQRIADLSERAAGALNTLDMWAGDIEAQRSAPPAPAGGRGRDSQPATPPPSNRGGQNPSPSKKVLKFRRDSRAR